MSHKIQALISGILLLAVTMIPMSLARAQTVSLQEQLTAQYTVACTGMRMVPSAAVQGARAR